MPFSIRPATENDAPSIVELLNPIIRLGSYTIMDKQISVADQIDFIRQLPEPSVYHVAVDNDSLRVLGIQDVQPISPAERAFRHVGEISTFVALDAHRQGIGRSLSAATLQAATERGYLKLRATIRADNPGALCFYRGQGFEVVGTARQHALVAGRYVDEVLAERFLHQQASPDP